MARPGRPAMPKPDLHPQVDAFLDMLTTERGAAMNTRQAYWRDLADVSLFLRNDKNVEIDQATTENLKAYLQDLGQKSNTKGPNKGKIAVRTVARRLSALRQFYRYLVSEGLREDDPTSTVVKPIKAPRGTPEQVDLAKAPTRVGTAKAGTTLILIILLVASHATPLTVLIAFL